MSTYNPALDANKAARLLVQQMAILDPLYAIQIDTFLSVAFQSFLDAPTPANAGAYIDTVISVGWQVRKMAERV